MTQVDMKRVLAVLLPAVLVVGCCTTPMSERHSVNLYPQQRDWWCWAATTEMISDYYGHRVQQCDSANFVHGTAPNCCTGCTGACPCWGSAWGASLADIKNNWTHWNFAYQYCASALSWADLKATLSKRICCAKSPVQAVWWWRDSAGNVSSGHVVAITGYVELRLLPGTLRYVYYNNPAPMDCSHSLQGLCQQAASGGSAAMSSYEAFKVTGNRTWEDSFYGFSHTGP